MTSLSVGDCLGFGWRTFKARPWFFVLVSLVMFAVGFASGIVQSLIEHLLPHTTGGILSFIISVIVNTFLGMGSVALYLKAHDAVMSAQISNLWHTKDFWKYLGTYVLLLVILLVGYVLLIIPGIILTVMLAFSTILVVEKGLGPIEALKESARMTKGHRWELFWLLLAIVGVDILGAIVLLVGLFVSIPVTVLAMVHAYRVLSGQGAPAAVPVYTSEPPPAAA